jgi:hypothetical protein
MGGMAFAFVAQLNRTDEAEAQAKSLDLEAHIAHETIGQLWERIFYLNDEVMDARKIIMELRDCYNPNDKCTIWECNCL